MSKPSEEYQTNPSVEHNLEEQHGVESEGKVAGGRESHQTESLSPELPDVQEELLKEKDKYLRLAAEFENYKRRVQRDQQDSIKFANESLLKNLLPIVDNLERAIKFGKETESNNALMEGVELTYKSFLETMGKLGVRQISSEGQPFDPTMHQAVAQVESETLAPNSVVEEFQKGYFLHDRILRPAMVTVSKETSQQTTHDSQDETGEKGGIRNG
jgi:molecular chaperone GrpE